MMTMGKRSALLVGCNYPNTPQQLHGCYNDIQTMHTQLTNRFGFTKKDIKIMIDAPNSPVKLTGINIGRALVQMIYEAKSGDTLFFFFSGLGTLVPAIVCPGNDSSPAIVSCDLDMIKDIEFRHLVNHLPKDATFTFLADSSHSSGLIFGEKEQKIPDPSGPEPREENHRLRPKTYLNPNQSSDISDIQSSDISAHLSEVFGTQVTANFNSANSQSGFIPCPDDDDNGILLSGCKQIANSFEVDNSYGAFTNAVDKVLKEHRRPIITNRELVTLARAYLHKERIRQKPCLFCSDKHADAPFLVYEIGS
ncbi:metacaspase-7-like [Magnolia sinica]|uniref:metacaspase-7-like n=1 Tax=Magnolia sinica TaxID=86752 RepID=UPI0026591FD1|nr:metacaspase-7-like [Magnolia sinica]